MIFNIEDLKEKKEILNEIDWDMTPEEAVRLYLEWGNNWARGNYVIRSKNDVSIYFVVNSWGKPPVIYLIQRNSEKAEELAKINIPNEFKKNFLTSIGSAKGVYAIEGEIKKWLKKKLDIK